MQNASITLQGNLVQNYDPNTRYLSNPRDKTFKKRWKGKSDYLDFGPYRSKVMLRGNTKGVPIVYLKGGPGSAPISSGQKQYWDPENMRIALSSWRGCGDSAPLGGIKENTTEDLLEDIETMRIALDVPSVLLAGWCWGGAVAFKYAARYPQKTLGVVTLTPYLARQVDINQSFGPSGIAQKYPEAYAEFVKGTDDSNIQNIFKRYATALSKDPRSDEAANAFVNWLKWESVSSGDKIPLSEERFDRDSKQFLWGLAGERVNINYVKNNYFLPPEGVTQDLDDVNKLTKQGKPVLYVAHRNEPLSAPDYMNVLETKLPNADRIVFESTDCHWLSEEGTNTPSPNYPIENAFAFIIKQASRQIQNKGMSL